MNWQDLVCAACSGRVADGNCASCRAARDEFSQRPQLPAATMLLSALALLVVLLLLAHLS